MSKTYYLLIESIIFVHGFNGNPKTSWTNESTGFYWPWELRNSLKQARIMAFGYDAKYETSASHNLMGIHDYAISLLSRTRNERLSSVVRTLP
jgi:hypothetical protein